MKGLFSLLKKPAVLAVVALISGFILGLVWGWVVQPVQFVDATPTFLRADLQEDYLRMTIDSYALTGDPYTAVQRWLNLGANAPQVYVQIQNSASDESLPRVLAYGDLIQQTVGFGTAPSEPAATPGAGEADGASATSPAMRYVIIIVAVVVIAGVIGGLVFLFRPRRSAELSAAQIGQEITRTAERTDYQSLGLAQPITQNMTTYVLGDDLYDESFSIDSPAGEFLGEYGVGISETIGVGETKRVAALEIWLFDKNDIKTATTVLMSRNAFNDGNVRARLEAKGDLVLVEPHKQVMLATATLQLMATIVDLEYGEGNLPPDSYFDRVTLELAIWPKQ